MVLSGKESTYQCRRRKRCAFNPWVGKIPGGGHGNSLQYSCLENPMDRGAWQATVHRVAKSQTWLKWLSTRAIHSLDFVKVKVLVAQSCPTLWPMDCLQGYFVHGILQAEIPEWVAFPFSRESSRLQHWQGILYHWATWETPIWRLQN